MSSRDRRLISVLVLSGALATALASVAVGVAAAAPAHRAITRGDVTAAFQTRSTGGMRNLVNGNVLAAPVRGLLDGRINSFSDASYCPSDWHYLGVTLLGSGGHTKALRYLQATSVTYRLDGQLVAPTMRTPIKPFVGTGIPGQWGVSVGRIVAPSSISTGSHHLETTIKSPDGEDILAVDFQLTLDACG